MMVKQTIHYQELPYLLEAKAPVPQMGMDLFPCPVAGQLGLLFLLLVMKQKLR